MGGPGVAGWRWLDVRSLSEKVIAQRSGWTGARLERVIFCTARISGASHPTGSRDQNVNRVATAPLAVKGPKGKPIVATAAWPIMVQDVAEQPVPDARFMVSVARREEKGSDVNVASHLLLDLLYKRVDAEQ